MIRYRHRTVGIHKRVVVSGGPDRDHLAHFGVLTMRPAEWGEFEAVAEAAASAGVEVEVVVDTPAETDDGPAGLPPDGLVPS